MRKLYRSIARTRMCKAGFRRINRSVIKLAESGAINLGSFFARNWRNYCLAPKKEHSCKS